MTTIDAIVVVTTTAQANDAAMLAETLVVEGHAACVQIIEPIRSIYRWQGRVEKETESLLLIKTTRDAYAAVERVIRNTHRQKGWYEAPEIIALPVASGSADYLEWLSASVTTRRGGPSV